LTLLCAAHIANMSGGRDLPAGGQTSVWERNWIMVKVEDIQQY
jgi:hypothetical protein